MSLTVDETTREYRDFVCDCCNTAAQRTWASVNYGETPVAVYYTSCYHHNGVHEVWIDAILGTWGSDDFTDHVTFGCRVGPVEGSAYPAATLVDGGAVTPDGPIFGLKLSREAGLQHPRLGDLWNLVDHVLEHDPVVNPHLYGRAEPTS